MAQESHEITLREQIELYTRNWVWFVLFAIMALLASFIYLRYATPIYKSTATILIKDEKNSSLSELAAFQDLGLTGSMNQSGFENELLILKSKTITERVAKELNLDIRYYSEGNISTTERYKNVPFRITILSPPDSLKYSSPPFYVSTISDKKFELWDDEIMEKTEYNFGKRIALPIGNIMITPNLDILKREGTEHLTPIRVEISSISAIGGYYRQGIGVEQMGDLSSVIQLSLTSPIPQKAEDILNELIRQYNQDAMDDRNMVAENTAEFIKGRLEIITKELDSVETGKVDFKQENRLTDIAVEGEMFLNNASEYYKRLVDVEMQLELVRTMTDYVRKGTESDLLPTNLGVEAEGVASAIASYNQLVLQRNRILASSTERNPAVVDLNTQIASLKGTILGSLFNAKTSLEIAKSDLRSQENNIGSKIMSIPSKEKTFRSITRQQNVKEALYLYLLQKREENAISLAVTTPKAKVVDYAYTMRAPVFPRNNIVILIALIIGLLIPFGFIYLKNLIDNKIRHRGYIERRANTIPVVGEIPQLLRTDSEIIEKNDRSILAESFRILRTNLEYLYVNNSEENENRGRTIFVTSTIKGEGKTLVAYNLALTLAYSGARVVIVGGDVRNPKLHRYTPGIPYKNGVVEFLVNENEPSVFDYIVPSEENPNLSLLFSGTIPPNPAELWMRSGTKKMFAELKQNFDYVIVDTAPCMLVTDTFLIQKYADVTLYVVRAGFTEKRLLEFPLESVKTKKLDRMAFVLNDVSEANYGYGNKYSYIYGAKEPTLWERFKKSF
ncbi:GumC family protein [Aequorivita ciconiae]|nr:polysaccharide biosynthesis tyrosine autokinase [Aequorivita sp. H23M31]